MEQISMEFNPPGRKAYREKEGIKISGSESYTIPFYDVILGWNPRSHFDGIEELSANIEQNGQEEPLRGYLNADGKFVVRVGGRRYRALQMIQDKDPDVLVMVKISPFMAGTKEEDILFSEVASSEHKRKLRPMEMAELINAMKEKYGVSNDKISERVGKSRQWVDNQIKAANLPPEIKSKIDDGIIGFTAAITGLNTFSKKVMDALEDVEFNDENAGASNRFEAPPEEDEMPEPMLNKGDKIIAEDTDAEDEMVGVTGKSSAPQRGESRLDVREEKEARIQDEEGLDFTKAKTENEEMLNKLHSNILWLEGLVMRMEIHLSDAEAKDANTRIRWSLENCDVLKFNLSKKKK